MMMTTTTMAMVVMIVASVVVCDAKIFPTHFPPTRKLNPNTITFDAVTEHHQRSDAANAVAAMAEASGYKSATFLSSVFPLVPGEVVFTDPETTILKFPDGDLNLHGFHAEVVDDTGASVPLNEAYLHHWITMSQYGNAGVCESLPYSFGVGAESRGSPILFPKPYALQTSADDVWGANIHILRTVDLDPAYGVKNCIECLYAPGKGCSEEQTGSFACCQDGSLCATVNSTGVARNLSLQYTVTYTLQNEEPGVKPVEVYVLDASNCQVEYNVYPNAANVSVTSLSYTVPSDTAIVFGVGHIHIAAYNATLWHTPVSGGDEKAVCVSSAVYGTDVGVPGNEKGYVVSIPPCSYDTPYPLRKGDVIRLESLYNVGDTDSRTWNVGMHGGVMTLFYLVVEK